MIGKVLRLTVLGFGLAAMGWLAVVGLGGASAEAMAPVTGYEVEVSIEPYPAVRGGFLFKASVMELGTRKVIAAPELVFQRGEPATAESSQEGSGVQTTAKVEIAADGARAVYEVVISTPQGPTSVHKAAVSL